jgi:aminopeptidase N
MRDAQPGTVYLKDYRPPAYLINRTELHFDLYEDHALVTSRLHMLRSSESEGIAGLELHGQELELKSVAVDGAVLPPTEYQVTSDKLVVRSVPDHPHPPAGQYFPGRLIQIQDHVLHPVRG